MARAIDADALQERIYKSGLWNDSKAAFYELIESMPTLTPPNEIPPCYRPDGDGCAYQCYDGQDEPIDKCKECPLCYSDKQRHHAPQNEPLTCEGCDMQGEKVTPCASCIRDPRVCDYYTSHPPEGEEDT